MSAVFWPLELCYPGFIFFSNLGLASVPVLSSINFQAEIGKLDHGSAVLVAIVNKWFLGRGQAVAEFRGAWT